ncbi:MAG TPA: PilC/PilY family type IV pilus protein [Gammaproteobacteria bacterium]
MNKTIRVAPQRAAATALGLLWTLVAGAPALADDTELFVVDSSQFPETRPNVLLIMDTSGSMHDQIWTQPTYIPGTYEGPCPTDRVYWQKGDDNWPPNCDGWRESDNWVERDSFLCDAAVQAFSTAGYYIDRMAQYDAGDEKWRDVSDDRHTRVVECQDDGGVHGDGIDTTKLWANNRGDPWSADEDDEINWRDRDTYTFYDSNWLNWYHSTPGEYQRKIDIVKDVAADLLNTVNGINVGLMRYNWNFDDWHDNGGPVIFAMEDISTAREPLQEIMAGLPADGNTPLAETMYEAALYYLGRKVHFGNYAAPEKSVNAARTASDPSIYKTPVEFGCQKNFIVYLSDGLPTHDDDADDEIEQLIGANCDGDCLDELAEYLYEKDISPTKFDGFQNVITHTIGFAQDIPVLEAAAQKGGGRYFQANNTAELTTALTSIVRDILETQTTFTSPALTINSFNRMQHLNDLYITMFEPAGNVHWPGNLKKYRLRPSDATIVDANGEPAVDGDYFAEGSKSFWSDAVDGRSVEKGGAANELPDPTARRLFTCLGCTVGRSLLSADGNLVTKENTAITAELLGLGATGDPARDLLIDFIRGVDVTNVDGESATLVRYQMGDPLHSQPATVMYDENTSIVYFATNDGYLHAIDTEDGHEHWAFIPEEFLPDMVDLYHDESTSTKHYGIDGSLRVHMVTDNNGRVDGTDKVYLYFGLRRGGDTYYALDVTDPDEPYFMWKLDASALPVSMGETWSNPVPTRINISGASYASGNDQKLVLVFGAGYDDGHDQPGLPPAPNIGNGIVIVDALNGNLLWHVTAGGGDMSAATSMPNMKYSFAADIKVVDLDGDKFADRMYAADLGGQIWRFDIFNGEPKGELVHGGVIAQLGGAPAADPPYADTRRFYYAPDVAIVNNGDFNFMHIGIGSGHRAHPNSELTQDRFYALRDQNPFKSLTQAEFDAREADPITEADLPDIRDIIDSDTLATLLPADADGWRMELREHRASDGDPKVWRGEKVLAEARTFDNKVFFTTFIPGASATANDCTPRLGTNRLYVVDLFTGRPVPNNFDEETDPDSLDVTDRYREFGGSIASEVVFLFPSPEDPTGCVGEECTPPPVACVSLFCFPPGFANAPVRTFWSQESIDD